MLPFSNHLDRNRPGIAYFSMEIGLRSEIPTYSGGLGVLAGDTVKSCADLQIPIVAVSLVNKKGYFRQRLTPEGVQEEVPASWNPAEYMEELPNQVRVQIEKRDVMIKAWYYPVVSPKGGKVPVLLLDTDVDGNTPQDREITNYLYGGDERYRFKQEIILGIGGVRMLKSLGFNLNRYHMNEGHSSLLSLELLRNNQMNLENVRRMCVFTTHTPIESAFDKFSYQLVNEIMGDIVPIDLLKRVGGDGWLNMTLLALNLSDYINGVSKSCGEHSAHIFAGYKVHAITNGVHSYTWTCDPFKKLYDKYLPGWADEPSLLNRVDIIPEGLIAGAHMEAKRALFNHIKEKTGVAMDEDVLTIGFARRATGYKRPTFIFSDLSRLRKANERFRIQLAFAGKSHPRDEAGKRIIKEIFEYMRLLKDDIKIVYLEDYSIDLSKQFVSGVDVWLNNPYPPLEASGTSGMKAAHNGVLNFSVLDGWWIEGWIEGVTGWAIGPHPKEKIPEEERRIMEKDDVYNKLSYVIGPLYYLRKDDWNKMMENSIAKLASYFNSHRMMSRYATEAYL